MPTIQTCDLPENALLARYRDEGAYVDCFSTDVDGAWSHAEYVEAFYTTPLFKLERWLLAWIAKCPSTDEQARSMARGELSVFSGWTIEARDAKQVLLCDVRGHTRSWLMTCECARGTRLYFGSAVVVMHETRSGAKQLGGSYRVLLGVHKLYSRMLLGAAARRLTQSRASMAEQRS